MGISKQPPKKFPITKGLPCQLKWTFSTIYLTDGKSASCHKARMHDYNVDGKLNFHNQPGKINERLEMLDGKWPAGCESCKHIEESGGHSDRVIQLFLEGNTAPPELEKDLEATEPELSPEEYNKLPDNKKIEVVANIGSEEEEKN